MRRIFFSLLLSLLFFPFESWAFEAQCLLPKQRMKHCDVQVLEDVLSVRYISKKDEKFNEDIPGDKITKINKGESIKKEMMKTFVLGPLMFFSLFDRNDRDKDAFGIEYIDAKGLATTLFIRLKKNEGFVFGTSLKKISGK